MLLSFISWYFIESSKNILEGWKNFLKFGLYYFSVPQLIKTYFSPWRRYKWAYTRGFDIWNYLEALFSNLIFRVLGAVFRTFFIVIGLLFELAIIVAGFLIFLAWLVMPVFIILMLYHGFRILF